MSCLTTNTLPSSEIKRNFHQMVKKYDAVKAINNIAVKMDASIENTKETVLGNCL